jgi:hypothetical protein
MGLPTATGWGAILAEVRAAGSVQLVAVSPVSADLSGDAGAGRPLRHPEPWSGRIGSLLQQAVVRQAAERVGPGSHSIPVASSVQPFNDHGQPPGQGSPGLGELAPDPWTGAVANWADGAVAGARLPRRRS